MTHRSISSREARSTSAVRVRRGIVVAAFGIMMTALAAPVAPASAAAAPKTRFANCTALNKVYPHGVGKVGARDKTTSKRPVRTFKASTALYSAIVRYNRNLDRDRDGIACEKL